MKKSLYISLIFCSLVMAFACRTGSEEKETNFDLEKFREKAENILNDIPEWEVKVTVKTIEEDRKGQYVSPEIQMAVKSMKYQFMDGKHTLFYIREMQYAQGRTDEAFVLMRKQGAPGDELPGLTYTNDFVMKKGSRIFWLNTACRYSWLNHTLLVGAFKSSFDTTPSADTISCQCGFNCD